METKILAGEIPSEIKQLNKNFGINPVLTHFSPVSHFYTP